MLWREASVRSALEWRPAKNNDTTSAQGPVAADAHIVLSAGMRPHKHAANASPLRTLKKRASKQDLFWALISVKEAAWPRGRSASLRARGRAPQAGGQRSAPEHRPGEGRASGLGADGSHTQVADGGLRETTDLCCRLGPSDMGVSGRCAQAKSPGMLTCQGNSGS